MVTADIVFIIFSTSLVMLMTPGLALFYGGLVRSRNVLSTGMHSFCLLGFITVLWALFGYSLAFGNDIFGIIGDFSNIFMNNVGLEPSEHAKHLPSLLFMLFQCMFAVLTVALISGAYAERIKFSAMLIFSCIWLFLAYSPMAHWVWGGGWLAQLNALDFAGGAVVHMSSAAAALAMAHQLKARQGLGIINMAPHNLPLTLLGGGLLWFGWFGFNAGSALSADGLAVQALVNTHFASAAGMIGWLLIEWKHSGKPTTLGAISGALAGLVAITPAAGFVETMPSLLIGFLGGMICYGGIFLKNIFYFDDALDVVGIHGLGGTWGAFATGLFAASSVNNVDGLFYGNPKQLLIQVISIIAIWAFSYIVSRIILIIIDKYIGLRVTSEEEQIGLDISQHNERAYQLL